MEQVKAKVLETGYTQVTKLEADDGRWEGEGIKNGQWTSTLIPKLARSSSRSLTISKVGRLGRCPQNWIVVPFVSQTTPIASTEHSARYRLFVPNAVT